MPVFDVLPVGLRNGSDDYWRFDGNDAQEYLTNLDAVGDLVVRWSSNAHLHPYMLGSWALWNWLGNFTPDPSSFEASALVARKIGMSFWVNALESALKEIHSTGTDPLSEEAVEIAEKYVLGETPLEPCDFDTSEEDERPDELRLAEFVERELPRRTVATNQGWTEEMAGCWQKVKEQHPDIWRMRQHSRYGSFLADVLLRLEHDDARPLSSPRTYAENPVLVDLYELPDGKMLAKLVFADAVLVADVETQTELARQMQQPLKRPDHLPALWPVGEKKTFMIDPSTRAIKQPKFLRPLKQRFKYAS